MDKADLLLKGGTFFDGKKEDDTIDFIAIRGNRILATGKAEDADQYID
jgi:predicted amidohydrolase YtcJ